jgi:integrase
MWKETTLRKFQRDAGEKPARNFDNQSAATKGLFVERGPAPKSGKPASMSFMLAYTSPAGKRRTMGLGPWPAVSMADAREKARQARSLLAEGVDPRSAREAQEAAAAALANRPTVETLLEFYAQDLEMDGKPTAREVRRMYAHDVHEHIGEMPVADVGKRDIAKLLNVVVGRDKKIQANRVRTYLHAAWQFGIFAEDTARWVNKIPDFAIAHNPVALTRRPLRSEPVATRFLDWAEVREVATTLPHTGVCDGIQRIIMLLLATGCRPAEVCGMDVSELKHDDEHGWMWNIPAARRKRNDALSIPLEPFHMELIGDLPESGLIFRNATGVAFKPLAVNQSVKYVIKRNGMATWSPKDCRTSFKTLGASIGIDARTLDRLQGHAIPGISAKHYNMYDYLAERRAGMQTYLAKLDRVLNPGSNVVALR